MTLTDGNLTIRPVEVDDLEEYWLVAYSNPNAEWTKWNGPYFHDAMPPHDKFVHDIAPRRVVNQPGRIEVILLDGKIVGSISAYYEDLELRKWLEIGIVIYDEEHWGQHIGTRAMELWIDRLFEVVDIPHLGFTTWSGNERMMKLGDRVGMQLEGRIRQVRYWDGKYWDSIKYGILRNEWAAFKESDMYAN